MELQHTYPLKVLLTVSRLSRSTDYYNVSCIDKDLKNDDIMNEMVAIYYTHQKRYGYRRIPLELTNKGYRVNHKKGKRLMSVMGLYGIKAKAKYKSFQGDRKGTAKNLLLHKGMDEEHHKTYYARDFKTGKCNEKWSTNVSGFHIATGKRYLSPIMDLHY